MKTSIANNEIENVIYFILNNFHIHSMKIFAMSSIKERSFYLVLHRNGMIIWKNIKYALNRLKFI